ncbi:MAG: NUDIX domain-containing protein [Candidatus Pacearchaeota archaeon]
MKGKYRKSVFIVVYRKEDEKIFYLLLKRHKHWTGWEFPKGGVERDENLFEAVEREVFEECGQKPINIERYNFSGKYNYGRKFRDRPGFIGQSFVLFSAEVKDEKVFFDEREHSSYLWLQFEEAIKNLTFDNQKEALKIVNERISNKKS